MEQVKSGHFSEKSRKFLRGLVTLRSPQAVKHGGLIAGGSAIKSRTPRGRPSNPRSLSGLFSANGQDDLIRQTLAKSPRGQEPPRKHSGTATAHGPATREMSEPRLKNRALSIPDNPVLDIYSDRIISPNQLQVTGLVGWCGSRFSEN